MHEKVSPIRRIKLADYIRSLPENSTTEDLLSDFEGLSPIQQANPGVQKLIQTLKISSSLEIPQQELIHKTPYGDLILNPTTLEVVSPLLPEGTKAHVTKTEGKMLQILMVYPEAIFSWQSLTRLMFGKEEVSQFDRDLIKQNISRLRVNIGDTPLEGSSSVSPRYRLVHTYRNRGYSLTPPAIAA